MLQKEKLAKLELFHKNLTRRNIYAEIECVKVQMEVAYDNFQNAVDPDLIDCCIYESNAAFKKYRFLLKQAKSLSV